MAKATTRKEEQQIDIVPITMGRITVHVLGTTPLIMHRFPKKAWEQLLFPKGRANAAEKAENLKHDPLNEFRESIYKNRDAKEPAAVHLPTGAFSKAIAAAALDLPGASRAQILRLVSVATAQINVFGIPQMCMHMVRNSDIGRTPDVRTRAIFPEWALRFDLEHVSSLIKANQSLNLLAAAGIIVGVGDWRPQKGGFMGKFKVVEANDPDYLRVIKQQGRVAQLSAMEKPIAYDADTEELFAWFLEEAERREKFIPSADIIDATEKSNGRRRRKSNGSQAHE